MFEPVYIGLHKEGRLATRAEAALLRLKDCRLCPRECGVDRTAGERGVCGTGRNAVVASCQAHFGEEAPLVGRHGSGTIFISGCNLLCRFCQNYEISHLREGVEVGPSELAEMMLVLAGRGCHNINIVTPSHVVPQLLEALVVAAGRGLHVPLVYNSGGYDSVETLRLLDGIVDIYMPDFKFWDAAWGRRLCGVPDYRERATAAVLEMHRQVGDLTFSNDGIAERGLLVRHLVMPGGLADTAAIMDFLAHTVSVDTYVNVMGQYHPCGTAGGVPRIARRLTPQEYADAVAAARASGLTRLDRRFE